MTTFENAKVGDRVWCLLYGWQTIESTDFNINYPIATKKVRTLTMVKYSYPLKTERYTGMK